MAATIIELSFFIGFFTKRFDRLLFIFFIAFLLMDLLIMRISYFEVIGLALPFFFSSKAEPDHNS